MVRRGDACERIAVLQEDVLVRGATEATLPLLVANITLRESHEPSSSGRPSTLVMISPCARGRRFIIARPRAPERVAPPPDPGPPAVLGEKSGSSDRLHAKAQKMARRAAHREAFIPAL